METVIFDGEDGTELEFGILEQTRVGGINYLLVIDPVYKVFAAMLDDIDFE